MTESFTQVLSLIWSWLMRKLGYQKSIVLMLAMLSVTCNKAHADWLCTDESSQRVGDTIHACGVGVGRNEAVARTKAFVAAKSEFDQVCEVSSDCAGHKTRVTPGRTTCEKGKSGFTCQRLVLFEIQAEIEPRHEVAFTTSGSSGDFKCYDGCDRDDTSKCEMFDAMFAWGCHE